MTLTQSDYGGGRIYLPVRIANVMGTMRFDSGASTTRVTLAPWNRDFPSVGQSDSTGASGQTVRCDDVVARNVELKASQGANIARATYDMTRCPVGDGDDLLGLNFFKGTRFTLDFGRREMTFFPAARMAARTHPFRVLGPDKRLIGVDLRIGGAAVAGLFDTGAEICAVDQQFVATHKKLFELVAAKNQASEAGGRRFSSRIYKIKKIDLGGGLTFQNVEAIVYDFGALRDALGRGTPFILGYNLLSRLNWDLDFAAASPTWSAAAR